MARLMRRRLLTLAALIAVVLVVKFSLTGRANSSHAFFDQSEHRWNGLRLWPVVHPTASNNNSKFNFSKVFGIDYDGIEMSHRHHHALANGSEALRTYRDVFNASGKHEEVVVDGVKRALPLWQLRQKSLMNASQDTRLRFYLVELLQVRLYESDKAKWTGRELKQWMHYMFLAGVDHIYVCDHFEKREEMIADVLKQYIELGLVTYMEWGEVRHPLTAQRKCYQHIIDQHKHDSVWQIAVDMDEYPFSPTDTEEDFLIRLLKKQPRHISEISMENFLMLGQGDRSRDLVIDRIDRRTPKPANVLVKPIYRPTMVHANIHNNHLLGGRRIVAHTSELHMLHYWGARLQEWGPDTDHIREITVSVPAMRDTWAERLRNSLLTFGEVDAFSNITGP